MIIRLSDTGCNTAESPLYANSDTHSLISGIAHMIISTTIPATPTAFFTRLPARSTELAALLIVLPIPGTMLPTFTSAEFFASAASGAIIPCTTFTPINTTDIVFIEKLNISFTNSAIFENISSSDNWSAIRSQKYIFTPGSTNFNNIKSATVSIRSVIW